jgi:CRP-like cAMP-binding protein
VDIYDEARQLSNVPIFSKLDTSKLKLIAFTSEQLNLADGDFLFHLNDPSDSACLILKGTVQVVVENEEGDIDVIVELGINQMVGEMGVIANAPRSASIRASGDVTVLRIEADTFMSLLSENPSMSLHVMRELTDKLHKSHLQVIHSHNHQPGV